MKLHSERIGTTRDGASAGSGRSQLRGGMGGVFAGSLEVIGERLNPSSWFARDAGREPKAAVSRLREVLDRDRALIAANPELNMLDLEPRRADAAVASAPAAQSAIAPAAVAPSAVEAPAPPAPPSVIVSTVMVCQEPIRTRTMARLLASQGHRERALSIYDYLLSRSRNDESLRAEADALRNPS